MVDNSQNKLLGRRRVYFFVSIWVVIALTALFFEESDKILHVVDDVGIVGMAAISLVYLWTQRKKTSPNDLMKQRKIITILYLIALAFQLYGIPTEISDAEDFGNEIPVLILIILNLLNGWV